jgi:PhzF family phenazine biosynthesis protein
MRIFQIDAFTDAPFTGNPAGVCVVDDTAVDAQWMQRVAAEMNLSETAFVARDGDNWALRWFTPTVEVALCGHATLATVHALVEEDLLAPGTVARFQTKSGVLTGQQTGDLLELDFPASIARPCSPPNELIEGLGTQPVRVSRSEFDYLVEMANEDDIRSLSPDHALLRSLPVRGVIVTSRASTSGFDFVSRFFAPASGVDEDPVTGSAHCALAPYWAPRLGKTDFIAYQASPRGGVVHVSMANDRIRLAGRAVTIFRGELKV